MCDLRYHVSELLKDKHRSYHLETSLSVLKMDAEDLQRSMQRLQERIDEVETEGVNNLEVRIDRVGEDAVRLTARKRRSRSPARRSH